MKKVTLDTNIIISAALSPNGKAEKILQLIFDGKVMLYYCEEILFEYENVLLRPKFNFAIEKQKLFIDGIKHCGILIEPIRSTILFSDESDRIFYDTAKECNAILITGNIKHYPTESFIMTPSEYLGNWR